MTDAQYTQVFWNECFMELMVLALMHSDASGDGSFNIVGAFIEGWLVVFPVAFGGIVFRLIFRWGNSGRRFHRIKERKAAQQSGRPTEEGIKVKKATLKRRKETKAQRRTRWCRSCVKTCRFYLGWLMIVLCAFVFICITMILCSQKFGEDSTGAFLLAYGMSQGQIFGMVEPLECLLLTAFPSVFENRFVAQARTTAKDIGLLG